MGWEVFTLCTSQWITWHESTGVINFLGFILKFQPRSDEYYHVLNSIYTVSTAVGDVAFATLAIAVYGPRRLWESSTRIHPLRLFSYVLACFGIIYVFNEVVYLCGIYDGDPAKPYVPGIVERLEFVLFSPIAEEFAFRLTLFQVIRSKLGFIQAALISSAAFGLGHFGYPDPVKMLTVFIVGLGFTWCYEKTGTILAPLSLHVMFNTWAQVMGF